MASAADARMPEEGALAPPEPLVPNRIFEGLPGEEPGAPAGPTPTGGGGADGPEGDAVDLLGCTLDVHWGVWRVQGNMFWLIHGALEYIAYRATEGHRAAV